MTLVILFGVLFKISLSEWFTCIILFGLVISGELFNTAIETVVDMVSPNINEKAKLAKYQDMLKSIEERLKID